MQCIFCLDSLKIILWHDYVTILLAKILIWAHFAQLMHTFSFCINPWLYLIELLGLFTDLGLPEL